MDRWSTLRDLTSSCTVWGRFGMPVLLVSQIPGSSPPEPETLNPKLLNLFVRVTGWLSPVNVASWKPQQLPLGLVADVPACFVHETEYPQLKMCRPLLSKQLNVFGSIVRSMFKEAAIDYPMSRTKSLAHWGVNKEVPSICIAPCTVRADVGKLSDTFWAHRRYSRAQAIPFQPPRDPVDCPTPFVNGHVGSVLRSA